MKDFLENPAALMGIPLLILGLIGLAIAWLTLLVPQPVAEGQGPAVRHTAHPGPAEYVRIGLILGAITAVEVIVYYFDIDRRLFITILVALSALKFTLVVLFFMHLKFDSRLLSTAFVTGLVLAMAVFSVVLATLGASLV